MGPGPLGTCKVLKFDLCKPKFLQSSISVSSATSEFGIKIIGCRVVQTLDPSVSPLTSILRSKDDIVWIHTHAAESLLATTAYENVTSTCPCGHHRWSGYLVLDEVSIHPGPLDFPNLQKLLLITHNSIKTYFPWRIGDFLCFCYMHRRHGKS